MNYKYKRITMKLALKEHLKIKSMFVETRKGPTLAWFTLMDLTVSFLNGSFCPSFFFFFPPI